MTGKSGRIMVVDDDPLMLGTLQKFFAEEYEAVMAASGEEAIEILSRDGAFDTVVLDIRMQGISGLETAVRIRKINGEIPIIFYTGYPGDYSESRIEEEYHPFDYIVKSMSPVRLKRAVRNAVAHYRLKGRKKDLAALAREEYGMVGKSRAMLELYGTIEKIAPTDVKVMILGPTGSGKELVARAIHRRSRQSTGQLGILHCSHKSADLVQSELFGHLKGSFTGAVADQIGLFEYANGGTVFLDEVGDLDPATQVMLLRVLEMGEMQKIGSSTVHKTIVRLICATNRDLPKMVGDRAFREDLFYRLKGVTITLPPLKNRREDVPDLISYFIDGYCSRHGEGLKVFEPDAMDLMVEYNWPGNVRQLKNAVESLLALSPSSLVARAEVSRFLDHSTPLDSLEGTFKERVRELKKILLIRILARHENRVADAAAELSLDRSNLYKMLKDLGIEIG